MGNPSLKHPHPTEPAPRVPTTHNGILAWIPAEFIASPDLPPAGPLEQPKRQVVVQVPSIGAVRITYELNRYKHRRSTLWHWRACWAEEVGG